MFLKKKKKKIKKESLPFIHFLKNGDVIGMSKIKKRTKIK